MKTIRHNIKKNLVYTFLQSTSFAEAIWMLFLAFRGMNLVQIGILESAFHMTSMFMEVPTGIIADRLGRKTSRILSRAMAFLGTVLMLSSTGFWGFLVAFIFSALSYNLESGAGDALIYDTLIECEEQDTFMQVKGRQEIAYQIARTLSLVAGGLVATYSYNLAYCLSLVVHLVCFIYAFRFEEPSIGRKERKSEKNSLLVHVRDSWQAVRDNKGIWTFVLFIEGFSLFFVTLYFYFQNFLKSLEYQEWQIGLVLATATVVGVLVSANAYKVEKRIGQRRMVSLTPFAAILAFALIAFSPIEPMGMILLSAVDGLLFVTFSDYINRMIPSAVRATLLSVQSMVFSVLMVVFFPIIGAIAENWGFKAAFILIFIVSVLMLLTVRRLLINTIDVKPVSSDV